MAQATILAVGTTAATSTDLIVAAGAVATIGVFTDSAGGIPANEGVDLMLDTPSEDVRVGRLDGNHPTQVVSGPCTVRAKRGVTSVNIGVFTET